MAISSLPGAPTTGAAAPASPVGGVLSTLPGAPKIAATSNPSAPPATAPASGGNIIDSLKSFLGLGATPSAAPAPAATTPAAPSGVLSTLPGAPKLSTAVPATQSAPTPATGGKAVTPAEGLEEGQSPTSFEGFPAATSTEPNDAVQSPDTTPGKYYYGTDNAGNTIGASNQVDSSGIPYFAYRAPGATSTTTDYTRVATTFDPTVAKPMSLSQFYNARGVAARAALKTQMGGAYSDELDHTIALELAGSNNPANLRIESGRTTTGGESSNFDQMENDLAHQVVTGQMSLSKAQYTLAAAKNAGGDNNPVPTVPSLTAKPAVAPPSPQHSDAFVFNQNDALRDPSIVQQYSEEAQSSKATADQMNTPSAIAKTTASSIVNWASTLGQSLIDHVKASVSSPQGALTAGQGVVQTAVLKPLAFVGGIASGILNLEDTGLDKVFGSHETADGQPGNVFAQLASMNDNNYKSPDEQKAYDTGNFLGWMVPYSKISAGVEAAADLTRAAAYAPKLAPLIPYISDAAGFLGTGQILHDPSDGSRVQQLKNDTIALALFDVGGFALKGGASMFASGLSKLLPASVKETADAALTPVVAKLHAGESVPADMLDNAVTQANTAIEAGTGKTPQQLIQEHVGVSGEQSKIPISPESVPAHNTLDKAIPMYHEQTMGRFQQGLDAIGAAKKQLAGIQKDLKNAPEDPALMSETQKASSKKAAALQDYIDRNKTFEQYWSGTKPGDTEPRAQAVLHNMTDDQVSQYTDQYKMDVQKQTALGYDMPKNITDQFPETKAAGDAAQTPVSTINIDTPERTALRQQVADKVYGEGAKTKGNRLDIVTGGPGTRKSSMLVEPLAKEHGSFIADSDAVKRELPEYNGGKGTKEVHMESAKINSDNLKRAIANGDNVVYPTVGGNPANVQKIADLAKANGYEVHLHHADLPEEIAQAGVSDRFKNGGQYISPEDVHTMHSQSNESHGILSNDDRFTSTAKYSTDVPRGAAPNLLEHRGEAVRVPGTEQRLDSGRGGKEPVARGGSSDDGGAREGVRSEIQLPDFPRRGQLVLGVAFPGADIIGKFIEKDVIEKFGGIKTAVKGIYDATKEMFSYNPLKEKAAAIVGSRLMETEKFASAAWKIAEARRDWWAKMPEEDHYSFLDKMETGMDDFEGFANNSVGMQSTLTDLAADYRTRLNKSFEFEGEKGVKENYIENYFPHMWEDPEEAARALSKFSENLPQGYSQAFGSFKSGRIVDLIAVGRSLGLKLITSNPEELVIIREIDGQRIAARMSIMKELEGEGLAHPTETFLEYGKPSNWSLVKGSDGVMYAVAPDAAKILNNAFFAPSFWTMSDGLGQKVASAMFKTLMAIKGTVVPFQLSLSGFHPFHVQTIASADAITQSFLKIVNGEMDAGAGFKEMAKGLSFIPQISDMKDFWNITKAWDTPMDKLQPRMRTAVQYIIDGGGTPKISEEFAIRAADGFKKAVSDGNYIGAAIRGVPKIVEALQDPILGHYVPSLKIGAYLSKVEDLLHAKPELATNDLARKVAFRAAWKEVDSRFGEMVYKTKFWNPMLTQIGEASFLSLGWQLGFVDQFAGGALDLAKLITKGVGGPLGLTEKATRADLTSRTVFSVVYTMQAAMWGGLMTYAMTGKMPQTVQDLFYPNTGKTNSDGSHARLNTPFYTREFFGLSNHIQKEGIVGGPVAMVQDKLNPILSSLAEIWNNKDFYGYEIHDPNSNVPQQAAQVLSYLVKNNFTPISIQGAIQANSITGRLGVAASVAGFNPAPKYIAENAIQTKIFATLDARSAGTKPLDSQAAANAKSNIKKLYQSGDSAGANTALKAAIQAGYIKSTGLTTFMKDADLPGDVLAFQSLTQYPSDQESLLAGMSEADLQRYAQYAGTTVKAKLSTLSPTAAQFVKDIKSGKIKIDTFKAGKIVTTP